MSKLSILSFIVLSISIGYAFTYPAAQELNALMGQKQKYEDTLEAVKNIEAKKNELLTKFNNIPAEDKKNIDTILPNSYNFVRLVSQIDNVAAKYGISIDKITSVDKSSSISGSVSEAQPSKPYNSAIVGFTFTSSYENFNRFIGDLEKSLRILDIRTMRLKSEKDGLYEFTVEFETYWLK